MQSVRLSTGAPAVLFYHIRRHINLVLAGFCFLGGVHNGLGSRPPRWVRLAQVCHDGPIRCAKGGYRTARPPVRQSTPKASTALPPGCWIRSSRTGTGPACVQSVCDPTPDTGMAAFQRAWLQTRCRPCLGQAVPENAAAVERQPKQADRSLRSTFGRCGVSSRRRGVPALARAGPLPTVRASNDATIRDLHVLAVRRSEIIADIGIRDDDPKTE